MHPEPGLLVAYRQVAEARQGFEVCQNKSELLEGPAKVGGQDVQEALGVEGLHGHVGGLVPGNAAQRSQGGDGRVDAEVDEGARRGLWHGIHLSSSLVLQLRDALVALFAGSAIRAAVLHLPAAVGKSPHGLGHALDDLGGGLGGVRKVARALDAAGPKAVTSGAAGQCSAGQTGAEGGRKRDSPSGPADAGRNIAGETACTRLGFPGCAEVSGDLEKSRVSRGPAFGLAEDGGGMYRLRRTGTGEGRNLLVRDESGGDFLRSVFFGGLDSQPAEQELDDDG
jgi:hypothetical protein